jgi:uncharacterized oxidoreductase
MRNDHQHHFGACFCPLAVVPTYSAAKAALHSYTVSMRYQLRASGIQVIETVPPMVQTGLQGKQGFNPAAMPIAEFIAQVMADLEARPEAEEIVVDLAKPMRFAERDGFKARFEEYNLATDRS